MGKFLFLFLTMLKNSFLIIDANKGYNSFLSKLHLVAQASMPEIAIINKNVHTRLSHPD